MEYFNVLLVGHSFVRRLHNAYQPGHGQGSDIAPGQTIHAAQLSEALSVHHYISGVYTHANNVILTQHLDSCKPAEDQIRPAVVVIQAGSNDLAQLSHFDANAVLQTATQIYQFPSSLREEFDTPIIIINAILPWTANISSDTDTFRQLSTEFNKIIKNFCDSQSIIYNKLRGFANYYPFTPGRMMAFIAIKPLWPTLNDGSLTTLTVCTCNYNTDVFSVIGYCYWTWRHAPTRTDILLVIKSWFIPGLYYFTALWSDLSGLPTSLPIGQNYHIAVKVCHHVLVKYMWALLGLVYFPYLLVKIKCLPQTGWLCRIVIRFIWITLPIHYLLVKKLSLAITPYHVPVKCLFGLYRGYFV